MPESETNEEIYYEDPTTPHDVVSFVGQMFYCLDFIDTNDVNLTDSGKRAIARIRRKSLKMLDWATTEIYDSIFDDETSNTNE